MCVPIGIYIELHCIGMYHIMYTKTKIKICTDCDLGNGKEAGEIVQEDKALDL